MTDDALASIRLTDDQRCALRALARAGSLVPPFVTRDAYYDLVALGLAETRYSNIVIITDVGRDFAASLALD
jgi:hypothetical protein